MNGAEDTFVVEEVAPTLMRGGRSASVGGGYAVSVHMTQDPITGEELVPCLGTETTVAVIPIQDAQRPRLRAQNGIGIGEVGDPMYTMTTRGDHAVFAFDEVQITSPDDRAIVGAGDLVPTITRHSRMSVAGALRPRRLTPREYERCFGFVDDYTAITYKRKPAKDSLRYEALGNSIAVPCLRWIGERIETVEEILGQRDDFGGPT